jgi:hypothetical protein
VAGNRDARSGAEQMNAAHFGNHLSWANERKKKAAKCSFSFSPAPQTFIRQTPKIFSNTRFSACCVEYLHVCGWDIK